MFQRLAIPILAILTTSCFKFDPRSRDKKEKTAEDTQVAPDADGVVKSKYDAQSQSDFEVTAKDAGAISGASIKIPPGALGIDTNVTLQEGQSIVSDAGASDMGLDAQGVSAAGPSVLFGTEDQSAKLSGNVQITLPLSDAQDAALNLLACTNYTVFYRMKDPTGQTVTGAYASGDLTLTETNITFAAIGFGIYQAACVGKAVETGVSKPTTDPMLSKKEEDALTPITWSILQPKAVAGERAYEVTVTAEGLTAPTCSAQVDDDKVSPAVKVTALTLGTKLKIVAAKAEAHTLYLRASCKDAGRMVRSDWSAAMAFVADTTQPGPSPGPAPSPETPGDNATAGITVPSANAWVNNASKASVTMSGSCSPAGKVLSLTANGTSLGSATCGAASWAKSVNLTGAGDGDVVLAVVPQGSSASAGATVTVKKDTVAPNPPTNVYDDGARTNVGPFIQWTAVSDAVSYKITYGTSLGGAQLGTVELGNVTEHTYTGTASNGQVIYAKIFSKDAAGNESATATNTDGIIYDDVAPIATVITATPSSNTPGAVTVTLDVLDATSYSRIEVRRSLINSPPSNCTTGMLVKTITSNFVDLDFEDVIGGNSLSEYGYLACAFDEAGNAAEDGIGSVHPSANPGPGCKLPPCDLPRGTTAPTSVTVGSGTYLEAGTNWQTVTLGDVAGSSKLDLVATTPSDIYAFTNQTSVANTPTFAAATPIATGMGSELKSVALADFDADNDLDLVGGGKYFSNTAGAFSAGTVVAGCQGHVAVGDFDRNGKLDIACSVTTASVLSGNGNGTFGTASVLGTSVAESESTSDIAVGDLDGNGYLDLVVTKSTGDSAGKKSIIYWNSPGGFGGPTLFQASSMKTQRVRLADVDNDADLDIVLFNAGSEGGRIFINTGSQSFSDTAGTQFGSGASYYGGSLAYDDPSALYPDVISNALGAGHFANWNGSTFGTPTPFLSDTYNQLRGDVGDWNGDGTIDYVVPFPISTQKIGLYYTN